MVWLDMLLLADDHWKKLGGPEIQRESALRAFAEGVIHGLDPESDHVSVVHPVPLWRKMYEEGRRLGKEERTTPPTVRAGAGLPDPPG